MGRACRGHEVAGASRALQSPKPQKPQKPQKPSKPSKPSKRSKPRPPPKLRRAARSGMKARSCWRAKAA
ncbi:hypothetical protein X962_4135 [Burkholderia pseudomallei MSHR7343]|nr:hypothetical protein X962_4135 [Burkholderia pseudomallei MSHR7343]